MNVRAKNVHPAVTAAFDPVEISGQLHDFTSLKTSPC